MKLLVGSNLSPAPADALKTAGYTAAPVALAAAPRARLTLRRRRFLWGLLFVSPWIIGTLGLVLYPMLLSLYYSFTNSGS